MHFNFEQIFLSLFIAAMCLLLHENHSILDVGCVLRKVGILVELNIFHIQNY